MGVALGSQSQRVAEVSVGDDHHVCVSLVFPEVSVRKGFFGRTEFRCLLHDCTGNVRPFECL